MHTNYRTINSFFLFFYNAQIKNYKKTCFFKKNKKPKKRFCISMARIYSIITLYTFV